MRYNSTASEPKWIWCVGEEVLGDQDVRSLRLSRLLLIEKVKKAFKYPNLWPYIRHTLCLVSAWDELVSYNIGRLLANKTFYTPETREFHEEALKVREKFSSHDLWEEFITNSLILVASYEQLEDRDWNTLICSSAEDSHLPSLTLRDCIGSDISYSIKLAETISLFLEQGDLDLTA